MKAITGLIGRETLVEQIAREARKGRHLLLTGPVGIGKSAVLEAVIDRLLLRQQRVVIQVSEHQAKGQFLEMARGLLESGLLKPSATGTGRRPRCPRPGRAGMGQAAPLGQPPQHPRPDRRHRARRCTPRKTGC